MEELRGMTYLERKLEMKRPRVETRYKYYEMKQYTADPMFSTPNQFKEWQSVLGWCTKGVDALADRLKFRGFDNDNFYLEEIFRMNNPDVFFDSAILSALISSCCFVYISPDEEGFPRLQVIDGGNATGVMDPVTGLLKEGFAVLERNDSGKAVKKAYFSPKETIYYEQGRVTLVVRNDTGIPMLVPIVYRPDEVRPFGHSRISRACMSIIGSALRTVKRSEISAEFYSYPQKYVAGLSDDVEIDDKWKASMSAMMTFTQDENGNKPTVGQFSQQSMTPYSEQLRMFAALFAGETGLTLDDLGFATENPSSAEAIRAAHENLRLTARKAQSTFGSGFLNVGLAAACLRDKFQYKRRMFYETKPMWEPIFEPDAAQMSGIGDAAIKINQAVPGYFGKENLRMITGIDGDEA